MILNLIRKILSKIEIQDLLIEPYKDGSLVSYQGRIATVEGFMPLKINKPAWFNAEEACSILPAFHITEIEVKDTYAIAKAQDIEITMGVYYYRTKNKIEYPKSMQLLNIENFKTLVGSPLLRSMDPVFEFHEDNLSWISSAQILNTKIVDEPFNDKVGLLDIQLKALLPFEKIKCKIENGYAFFLLNDNILVRFKHQLSKSRIFKQIKSKTVKPLFKAEVLDLRDMRHLPLEHIILKNNEVEGHFGNKTITKQLKMDVYEDFEFIITGKAFSPPLENVEVGEMESIICFKSDNLSIWIPPMRLV